MKQESGINKISQSTIHDDDARQDRIGQAMTPDSHSPGVSGSVSDVCNVPESSVVAEVAPVQASKRSKVKVIPLRKEDIDAGQVSTGRNRMMIGLVVVLGIVMGFIIMKSMGSSARRAEKSAAADVSVAKNDGIVTTASINWNLPGLIKSARDVTRAAAEIPETPDVPQLQDVSVSGIIVYSNNDMSAIIGDQIYKIGDVVEGAVVYKILKDSVVFEMDGIRLVKNVE
jgi:hypothetical protein